MLIKFSKSYTQIRFFKLILPIFLLGGCTDTLSESANLGSASLSNQLQTNILIAKPVETYTFTARMVHKCWLNNAKPLIPNHVFFASASRKGGEKAHIGIHQRAKLGRKGPAAFAIIFTSEGMGTSISMMNYKFPPAFADRLKEDVNRWTSGDATCPPPVDLIAASADTIPVPIPEKTTKKIKKKVSKKTKRKSKKKEKSKKK